MKISVIIATYNRRDALKKSVQSVLDQSYLDLEIIVVDDGSTDETEDLFKTHFSDKRIWYVSLKKNVGPTGARNKGLEIATGDYTLVWDSDDVLSKEAISKLVDVCNRTPDAIVASAPTRVFVNMKHINIPTIPEGEISFKTILCAYMPKYKLIRLVKKSIAGDVRYRGRNLDFMYNTEIAVRGKWMHVIKPLGDHFILSDKESLTGLRRKPNPELSMMRAEIIVDYLSRFEKDLKGACPKRYAAHAYGAAVGLLLAHKWKRSLAMSSGAIRFDMWNVKYLFFFIFSFAPFSPWLLKKLFFLKKYI